MTNDALPSIQPQSIYKTINQAIKWTPNQPTLTGAEIPQVGDWADCEAGDSGQGSNKKDGDL